jgi:hypothetical protein
MSVGESILRSSIKVKRRLFDRAIQSLGRETQIVRVFITEEDIFGDQTLSVISGDVVHAVIRFPDQMSLDRFRIREMADDPGETISNSALFEDYGTEPLETRTYFYEILPIECYTKISDSIETRDILAIYLEDENNNFIPFLFQVTESFGKFDYGLVWKMQYLAQYNGQMTEEIMSYLTDNFSYPLEEAT